MPSPQEMLKEQVEKSIKLTNDMLNSVEGLEAKIADLDAKGVGVADLKEQVERMSNDNAKAIDSINELTKEIHARQDEFEAKIKENGVAAGAAVADIAAPVVKALPADGQRMSFQQKVKADVDAQQLVFGKTVTSLEASGQAAQVPAYEPTILAPGQQSISLLNVLPRTTTETPMIYWVQEVLGSRTNGVAIQSLDFTGTDQGTALGLSDFVFEQKSQETATYGHRAKIALQMLQDVGQMRGYMENQMRYMVQFDLEDQVLNGDNTGKNFNGLKNQATAYDVTLDANISDLQKLDVLATAIHQCALTFFPATASVLHPTDEHDMKMLKDANKQYLFARPMQANSLRPWGVPVVSTTQQTADEFTVGAFNHVEVVIRKAIEVLISTENEDDFNNLLATIRAYGRGGMKVYRPGSIIDGDFSVAITGT